MSDWSMLIGRMRALLLQHVLPKGFHRVRDYGLLHPKRSALLGRVQLMLQVRLSTPSNEDAPPDTPTWRCPHCGGRLRIIATRLAPLRTRRRSEVHDGRSGVM